MDFFLPQNDLDTNTRAAPEETKIIQLTAQPYSDGYRLRVNMEITPFQIRPYIEVILRDAENDEVASTNFVEPMSWKLEFTMHIRGVVATHISIDLSWVPFHFYPIVRGTCLEREAA